MRTPESLKDFIDNNPGSLGQIAKKARRDTSQVWRIANGVTRNYGVLTWKAIVEAWETVESELSCASPPEQLDGSDHEQAVTG